MEHHDVRLPIEFTQHCLEQQAPHDVALPFEAPLDTAWWLAQRGSGRGSSFRSPAVLGDFIAVLDGAAPSAAILAALREFAPLLQLSVASLRERILGGMDVVLLQGLYETPRPPALAKLDALGIPIRFRPSHPAPF